MPVEIQVGDALSLLRAMPSESIHCAVTSPPYYGLRNYGVAGQIGLEETPEAYIDRLVAVFREVCRVLRSDGTLWLNIGDSYSSGARKSYDHDHKLPQRAGAFRPGNPDKNNGNSNRDGVRAQGTKPKDLLMIPAQLALALRADGWYLRRDIIWHKTNPMPESVRDRCTSAHEYLFHFAKSEKYYYDGEAIKEPAVSERPAGNVNGFIGRQGGASYHAKSGGKGSAKAWDDIGGSRNRRSVWTIASKPCREAHFATFPPALVEPCILAGTSERGVCKRCGAPWERIVKKTFVRQRNALRKKISDASWKDGWEGTPCGVNDVETTGWRPTCSCRSAVIPATVLDPFFGAGTTGLVAEQLGRDCIGIELNQTYAEMARRRIEGDRVKRAA